MFSSIMVFGSGNKFRIRRSQSKASYLSGYRREAREKGLPQGSYKRTMSPSGGRIIDTSVVVDRTCVEKDVDILKEKPLKEVEELLNGRREDGVVIAQNNNVISKQNKNNREEAESPEMIKKSPTLDEEVGGNRAEEAGAVAVLEVVQSKTLPRNYSAGLGAVQASAGAGVPTKRAPRPPRAQSDPTSQAKPDKKSASTQDNLDEFNPSEEKGVVGVVTVGRTLSEGAKEHQRSRMSDASSQTTPVPSPPPPSCPSSPPLPPSSQPPPPPSRRQLQEEIDCEQLSRDLASQLSPSHRLHTILVPGPDVKRSTDYVTGLFRMDVVPRSRSSPVSTTTSSQQTNGKDNESLSGNNAYYTTSECKARLMSLVNNTSQSEPINSMNSLQQKKEELMTRLTRKLSVLKAESVAVSEETSVNESLGRTVTERVERVARPQEAAKFRLHVKEVGHITSLLLGLSGRLARAENALLTLPNDHHDRKTLESKRDKLLEQLNEAKQLKSNIDKRSESVSTMLYNYLSGEEYTDYDHFINMKSKLLVDSREIAEKIQLGEEQLSALKETLDQVR